MLNATITYLTCMKDVFIAEFFDGEDLLDGIYPQTQLNSQVGSLCVGLALHGECRAVYMDIYHLSSAPMPELQWLEGCPVLPTGVLTNPRP